VAIYDQLVDRYNPDPQHTRSLNATEILQIEEESKFINECLFETAKRLEGGGLDGTKRSRRVKTQLSRQAEDCVSGLSESESKTRSRTLSKSSRKMLSGAGDGKHDKEDAIEGDDEADEDAREWRNHFVRF
jgi:hypothetical protein